MSEGKEDVARSGWPGALREAWEASRRAYREFLKIPAIVIAVFLVLAFVARRLDLSWQDQGTQGTGSSGGLFRNSDSTRDFLSTITSSLITVTSITFSLLLIAVQQGAASMTSVVLDQFLRRQANRFYFGFFVGLSLYTMIILATVSPDNNPVIGASIALVLTMAALVMLILLIYTTIDQMRSVTIVGAIRDHTLRARECQRSLLAKTRRDSRLANSGKTVTAATSGFLVGVDVEALGRTADEFGQEEIVITPSIGDYVSFHDPIAELTPAQGETWSRLEKAVQKALRIEQERDLGTDPAYGVAQLLNIGWTSISTSKQNPEPGLLVCLALRELLARWSEDAGPAGQRHAGSAEAKLPVVYRDRLLDNLMNAFASIIVVASESMQHQALAEAVTALALTFPRLPAELQTRTDDLMLRALSSLGDHVLTQEADQALTLMANVLSENGRAPTAEKVDNARTQLAQSIGVLSSRATRVPPPSNPE